MATKGSKLNKVVSDVPVLIVLWDSAPVTEKKKEDGEGLQKK